MKFEAKLTEALLRQTAVDHVERRHFFRDKQYPPAQRHVMGNHVGDGLRLSCPWRAIENKVTAAR